MEPTRIALTCEKFDNKTAGFALRRNLTTPERAKAAAKITAIFLLVGFFTIFIPILHFILPPLFLLLALFMGYSTWSNTGLMLSGEIDCPACKNKITLPEETETWPYSLRCPSCHVDLVIESRG